MAVSSGITTIVTIVLAFYNYRYMKLTEKIISSHDNPYVYATILPNFDREGLLQLIVKNIGLGIANNIKVTTDFDLFFTEEIRIILKQGINSLGHNDSFKIDLQNYRDYDSETLNREFTLRCSFNKGKLNMEANTSVIKLYSLKYCPT
jgi:hypothetical protein